MTLVWIGIIALNLVLKNNKPFPPLLLHQQANTNTVRENDGDNDDSVLVDEEPHLENRWAPQ